MHRRTLCCPLQMVQYFSQVQRSSGKSHCAQFVGPSMGPLPKMYLSMGGWGKANVTVLRESRNSLGGERVQSTGFFDALEGAC
jgi:hypothetical protein